MDTASQIPAAAQINLTVSCSTKAGWRLRAEQHYEAAVRQHTSGDVNPEYTRNEILLAELCLKRAETAQS
ncbi:hypothetical protein ABT095_33655 [Kitasatospora sp. NPDC002227]|uniref:hypothetical protein n=1 Tax=Kitasatospora sp. NPDC002227 TaxID=3154773 RepID=UPI00331C9FCD